MEPKSLNSAPTAPSGRPAYDVFNGDADGICALHQLRLAYPQDATLVTGVKRDIELLQRIPSQDEMDVIVMDVSLDVNAVSLRRILDGGGRVTYFDHHSAKQAFQHPRLQLHWNDAPEVCTSILVDRHLQGRFRPWAIVAAFGDNLQAVGRRLARGMDMDESRTHALEELGRTLNYNAYGERVEDLHMAPDALYREVHQFADPFDLIETSRQYRLLAEGYRSDAARMADLTPEWQSPDGAIYLLPCAPWARRISGIFANKLATPQQARSYAVLTEKTDGAYVVSVRAGQPALRSANGFCERFATGGGRKAAGGINHLPASGLDDFVKAFSSYFSADGMMTSSGAARANGE